MITSDHKTGKMNTLVSTEIAVVRNLNVIKNKSIPPLLVNIVLPINRSIEKNLNRNRKELKISMINTKNIISLHHKIQVFLLKYKVRKKKSMKKVKSIGFN